MLTPGIVSPRLCNLAGEYERVTNKGGHNERADEIEIEFHGLILEMTGNPLIAGMYGAISDYFRKASRESSDWHICRPETVWEHNAIAGAFASRDTEMARAYLKNHFHWRPKQKKGISPQSHRDTEEMLREFGSDPKQVRDEPEFTQRCWGGRGERM